MHKSSSGKSRCMGHTVRVSTHALAHDGAMRFAPCKSRPQYPVPGTNENKYARYTHFFCMLLMRRGDLRVAFVFGSMMLIDEEESG